MRTLHLPICLTTNSSRPVLVLFALISLALTGWPIRTHAVGAARSQPAAISPADIVLYASETAVKIGNWMPVSDATAAGGARLSNPDLGAPKIVNPVANPASYFEMSFGAQAGTAYRLWIRGKAQDNSPYNDSVFVQFSSSVDSGGAAQFRIGTTSGTTINLEDDLGVGLSGWGWQDNGWGTGVLGPLIYFANSGTQTLRIQVREDGLSIDQIVLSPGTYLNSAPGALKNDTTILPKQTGAVSPAISAISPNTGSTDGGTFVTISGSNFQAGASVNFGGTPASNVTVTSSTMISAVTPPRPAGTVSVNVANTDGQSGTLPNGFTYIPATPMPAFGHVFIVIEENHSYETVTSSTSMPYLNGLANKYGLATNYFANAHPSIGNYFELVAGQLVTNNDSFSGTVSVDNIVRELSPTGKTWKSYAESLPAVGYLGGDSYPYVKRHNPLAYLSDVVNSPTQANNIVPFSQFAGDLANNRLPNYSFIIPNQQHNSHDCPAGIPNCTDADELAASDNWLSANIEPLIESPLFKQDGLLIIVYDESLDTDTANGGGHIAAVVVSAKAKPGYRSTSFYQHQNSLRTLAEALGLTTFPGAAATASNMAEFIETSAPGIVSVSPNTGAATGGTNITVTGSHFSAGATVTVGGAAATNINVANGNTITATTPSHAAGSVDLVVTNADGQTSTLVNGYTYTNVAGGETVLLADDFNDNSLNATKWNAGSLFSGFTDSALPVAETNQRIEIGPLLQGASGSHYAGIRSAAAYDFTNAYCYVELVQAGSSLTSADAMLTVGVDVNGYYRIYVEGGSIIFQKRISGSKVTLSSASYNSTNDRFWRIRHDATSGKVFFETAPGAGGTPGTWTARYSEPWNLSAVPLSSTLFEIKGGTWQAEANAAGKVIFDNFRAAKLQ